MKLASTHASERGSRARVTTRSAAAAATHTATAPRRRSWAPAYSAGKTKKICAVTVASLLVRSSTAITAMATNGYAVHNHSGTEARRAIVTARARSRMHPATVRVAPVRVSTEGNTIVKRSVTAAATPVSTARTLAARVSWRGGTTPTNPSGPLADC